ncbi:MAG: hypothetical protein WA869_16695 [Alloacidobacterium sp.]
MKQSITKWLMPTVMIISPLFAQQGASHPPSPCTIRSVEFDGWHGEEVANDWVRLTFVPQLGGRLMQVAFNGHNYLFVNPVYKGKYVSPSEADGRWINYGGDKIWPLPEGNDDEQHWNGVSTALDDGMYTFTILSQSPRCAVRLDGPPDKPTGLQYTREISIGNDSPEILFHAITKNISGHSITWSVQSVSQYDLSDPNDPKRYNHDFWAFAAFNPSSVYLNGYHVYDGFATDPSFKPGVGLFRLNWKYLENEVWLDSTAGWVALVDGATHYAMVEKTKYFAGANYPGKATVIFYKNGPSVRLNSDGMPYLTSTKLDETPYYMEAELNSPMAILTPGQTYTMDAQWFPTRASQDSINTVTEAGLVVKPLTAKRVAGKIDLSGSFGIFFPGEIRAFLYDAEGTEKNEELLQAVRPQDAIDMHQAITATTDIARVSVHLIDSTGLDRGALGEVFVTASDEQH